MRRGPAGRLGRGTSPSHADGETEALPQLTLSTELVFFPSSASFLQTVVAHKAAKREWV